MSTRVSKLRRQLKRKLLGVAALAAGALGFGSTVACAYGPGPETSCTSTEACRSRLGAGYFCDRPAGQTWGTCEKRTHFDRGADSSQRDSMPDSQLDLSRRHDHNPQQ